jgi:hypothetical protein
VKSFDHSYNTTPQQHNNTTPQQHNTTTQQHHNTTTQQHNNTRALISKALHHRDPSMLLLLLALTKELGSQLNCDSFGQLGEDQHNSARAVHNSARAIHNSARAIHNLARAVHKGVPERSEHEDLL